MRSGRRRGDAQQLALQKSLAVRHRLVLADNQDHPSAPLVPLCSTAPHHRRIDIDSYRLELRVPQKIEQLATAAPNLHDSSWSFSNGRYTRSRSRNERLASAKYILEPRHRGRCRVSCGCETPARACPRCPSSRNVLHRPCRGSHTSAGTAQWSVRSWMASWSVSAFRCAAAEVWKVATDSCGAAASGRTAPSRGRRRVGCSDAKSLEALLQCASPLMDPAKPFLVLLRRTLRASALQSTGTPVPYAGGAPTGGARRLLRDIARPRSADSGLSLLPPVRAKNPEQKVLKEQERTTETPPRRHAGNGGEECRGAIQRRASSDGRSSVRSSKAVRRRDDTRRASAESRRGAVSEWRQRHRRCASSGYPGVPAPPCEPRLSVLRRRGA